MNDVSTMGRQHSGENYARNVPLSGFLKSDRKYLHVRVVGRVHTRLGIQKTKVFFKISNSTKSWRFTFMYEVSAFLYGVPPPDSARDLGRTENVADHRVGRHSVKLSFSPQRQP